MSFQGNNEFFIDGVFSCVDNADVATEIVYDDAATAPSDWDRVVEHIIMSNLSFKETPSIDNDAPLVQARYNWHHHRKNEQTWFEKRENDKLKRERRERLYEKKWKKRWSRTLAA